MVDPPLPMRRPDAPPILLASAGPEIPPGPPRPRPRGLIDVIPPRADVPSLPTERPAGIVLASIVPTPTISQPREETNVMITATAPQTAFAMEPLVSEIVAQPALLVRAAADDDLTLVASIDNVPMAPVETGVGDLAVLPSPNKGVWPPPIAWEVPMPSLAGAPLSMDSPLARAAANDLSAELYAPDTVIGDTALAAGPVASRTRDVALRGPSLPDEGLQQLAIQDPEMARVPLPLPRP
jgi:hypothetical protein